MFRSIIILIALLLAIITGARNQVDPAFLSGTAQQGAQTRTEQADSRDETETPDPSFSAEENETELMTDF